MKVHRILGPGYLESVYKNALSNELRAQGLHVEREVKFKVFYEGDVVGDYSADMHVEGAVLVEVKAARAIVLANEKQLVNYLTGIRAEVGLLLNFGAESLQVRRKVLKYRPPAADRWSAADRGPKRLLSAEPVAFWGVVDSGGSALDSRRVPLIVDSIADFPHLPSSLMAVILFTPVQSVQLLLLRVAAAGGSVTPPSTIIPP